MIDHASKFYFGSTRKITAAFGSLFDSIYISRFAASGPQKAIKIPFAYGPTEKWLNLREQREIKSDVRLRMMLPRMSFELTGMSYDPTRQLPAINYANNSKTYNTTPEVVNYLKQYTPAPYNFNYNVYLMTKTIDDGLQVIEQVLPYFTPSFNMTINEIPELGITRDVPVIYKGLEHQDTYISDVASMRVLTWTLSFEVKGYLYKPIENQSVIKKIIDTIYGDQAMETNKEAVITVQVNPLTAGPDDDYTIDTDIQEFDNTTS